MRDSTVCRRPMCRKAWSQHQDGRCPELGGLRFLRHVVRVVAGQSFNKTEIDCMDFIVRGLLSGADIGRVVRMAGFNSICRKTKVMRTQIDARKSLKASRG